MYFHYSSLVIQSVLYRGLFLRGAFHVLVYSNFSRAKNFTNHQECQLIHEICKNSPLENLLYGIYGYMVTLEWIPY